MAAEAGRPWRILVVGDRGVGKTTLCLKVAEAMRQRGARCGGVLCPKILGADGEVLGIEILDLGEAPPSRQVLARTDRRLDGPSTGAYHFSAAGFRFGMEALARGAARAEVLFADEWGPLEVRGEGFVNLLDLARAPSVRRMVITVRPSLREALSERLRGLAVSVQELDSRNRERAVESLLGLLLERAAG